MKKTFLALSTCLLFTFCSHKTLPEAPTGVSNVTVGSGDKKVSASKAAEAYSNTEKDYGYKANPDTSLNGKWTMTGMLQSNGTWSTVEKNDAPATVARPPATTSDTAMTISGTPDKSKTSGFKRKKPVKRDPLYAASESRLKMDYKTGTSIDTSAVEPYAYWKNTPNINITKSTFFGNTGCNSMSGSINYSNRDMKFGQKVATSKMACMDYDESNFLSLLQKADNYSLFGNTLQIRQGTTVLLTFKKD